MHQKHSVVASIETPGHVPRSFRKQYVQVSKKAKFFEVLTQFI